MKYLNSLKSAGAALLLVTSVSILAQPAPGEPGGPGGRGGRGGRGGVFGPPLPPEQQALVDKFNTELAAENTAVTLASSNLVVATFSTPKDDSKIIAANQALAKARETWATKASALFAKTQASETKLSEEAIARLVATASAVAVDVAVDLAALAAGAVDPAGVALAALLPNSCAQARTLYLSIPSEDQWNDPKRKHDERYKQLERYFEKSVH